MSVLLGFSGEVGSGKTAACAQLHEVAGTQSAEHIEFSDNVIKLGNGWMNRIGLVEHVNKQELEQLRGVTHELFGYDVSSDTIAKFRGRSLNSYLETRRALPEESRVISLATKDTHRSLLQWLGHEFTVQVDGDFWNKTIEDDISKNRSVGVELITVGGVRYSANADLIHSQQGHVVEVVRPGHRSAAQAHISERGLPAECVDITILNDGTLKDLGEAMLNLWDSLSIENK